MNFVFYYLTLPIELTDVRIHWKEETPVQRPYATRNTVVYIRYIAAKKRGEEGAQKTISSYALRPSFRGDCNAADRHEWVFRRSLMKGWKAILDMRHRKYEYFGSLSSKYCKSYNREIGENDSSRVFRVSNFFLRRLPKINKKLITCVHQKEMHSDGNHFPSDSEYYHRAGTHFRLEVISTPLNVAHYHSTITNCRFFWQSFSSRSSLLRDCSVAHSRSLAFDFRTQLVVRYN